jgi:broad specificity phosphatase PhoE
MSTLYLIRHGQASFGSDNYDQLSDLGRRQATVLGKYLRNNGIYLDAVYSGDLERQRDTARLALLAQPGEIEHHVDARFNEIDNDAQLKHLLPDVLKGDDRLRAMVERGLSSSKDYQKVIEAVFKRWVTPGCQHPELQSWADYSGALHSALSEVISQHGHGRTVAIFSSGGTIASMVAHVLGMAGEDVYKLYEPMFNCSVSQLFYSDQKVSLSYFNDRSFLQVMGAQQGENLVTYR